MILFKCRGTTIRTSGVKILILVSLTLVVAIPLFLNGILLARGIADKTSASHYSRRPRENATRIYTKGTAVSVVKYAISETLPSVRLVRNRSVSAETQLLRRLIRLRNEREHIRNLDKFPNPVTTLIVVIQVHNRPYYFSQLVRSLAKADGIQEALLVISHDFYSDEMNNVVDAIEYCKVVQIFFPYSQQLYPNEFPGSDPDDCPRDFTKAKALDMKCNNAEYPDMYGHYRETKFTGTKHHWWWKINHVFDNMNATRNNQGPILFLEEDHFVAPDFYRVLRLLYDARKSYDGCWQGSCDVLSLGAYNLVEDYKAAGPDKVELIPWSSVTHNMGMAIDKETWLQLKNCEQMFCTYDDYNWDWTLMKLSTSCMKQRLQALVVKAPRVFHVGECGLHHKGKDCNSQQTIAKFEGVINRNMASLFPSSMTITTGTTKSGSLGKPNGGWGDPRDHNLCRQFVKR